MDHWIKPLQYLGSKGNQSKKMENSKVICTKITGWADEGGGRQLQKKENAFGFEVLTGKVLFC